MTNDEKEKMWHLFRCRLMATLHKVVADIYENAKSTEETNMAINECMNYHMHFIGGRPEWFHAAHDPIWQKATDRIIGSNLSKLHDEPEKDLTKNKSFETALDKLKSLKDKQP